MIFNQSNQNADAVSRQYVDTSTGLESVPGMVLPLSLQESAGDMSSVPATQSSISVLPNHSPSDLEALQRASTDIYDVFAFLERKRRPTAAEHHQLSLLCHWNCIATKEDVLYCRISHSNRGKEVIQLALPTPLQLVVMAQLHQNHGHQGIDRTSRLVQQQCYWPVIIADIKRWCQECDVARLVMILSLWLNVFWGHLLASQPNLGPGLHFDRACPYLHHKYYSKD